MRTMLVERRCRCMSFGVLSRNRIRRSERLLMTQPLLCDARVRWLRVCDEDLGWSLYHAFE